MDIYTVSFFGHREIANASDIEDRLDKLLHDLIAQHEYVEFIIGREGEFDLLVTSAIKRAVKQYGYGNASLILVLPYTKAEYRNNAKEYLEYYDEVEVCTESSEAHFKGAIQIRNRCMVDRSDLVVCCIQRQSGGAYKTMLYAEKQGKRIVNIADEIE